MKFVTGLVAVFAVLWVGYHLFFAGIHIDTGNGQHTGYVTAVEKNGLIWKTGRAYVKTSLETTQEDIYCVTDEKVYTMLEWYSRNPAKLNLSYNSWILPAAWECHGEDAIINAATVVN